jgi:anaphase-promoting complex subunit 8
MSTSLSKHMDESELEQGQDLPMDDDSEPLPSLSTFSSLNLDPQEARMESKETLNYLLAKTYFDCKEFERCVAVFFPSGLPQASPVNLDITTKNPLSSAKGKSKASNVAMTGDARFRMSTTSGDLPGLSQRSLFLALYAKYMAGEKRKDEDREMLLGAADQGLALNKELIGISRLLENWFSVGGVDRNGGGWLEYLLGIVLAKGKNEDRAIQWLIRSVHLYPYNWGAWLELNDLVGSVEEV